MSDHSGQRIVIVGGTAGIGLTAARLLLGRGAAKVVIAGRTPERGAQAVAELGENASYLPCDAKDPALCDELMQRAAAQMGGIDALISCGGGDPMPRLLRDIPTAEVMSDVNDTLAPVVQPARAVLPVMAEQGHGAIVCVASDAGKLATPGEVAIGAAMAGIIMFCRAMATEVKRNGIRVNCVTPSIVQGTPLYDKLMADPFAGKLFTKAETMASLGVANATDVAEMLTFLISPAAARTTGQTVSVTGGISAI